MTLFNFMPAAFTQEAWRQQAISLVTAACVSYCLYYITVGVYNVYFSPLRIIPGPKLWIFFPILRYIALLRGRLEKCLVEFHDQYGHSVRIGPNELSFNNSQAWKDIYAHGHRQLPKAVFFHEPDGKPDHLIHASIEDHSRYRKIMSGGFSEKSIRKQEHLIKVYVDLFIDKMREMGQRGEKVDMVKWLQLTIFDLIGDLAFGEPFGGVSTSEEHDYVRTMFLFIKSGAWLSLFYNYPLLGRVASLLTPKALAEANVRQWKFSEEVTMRRLNNKEQQGRGDFMDAMVESRNTPGGMTDQEILVNASILISAGAETSATTLSGALFLLLTHRDKLAKAVHEVRSTFGDEKEIDFITSSSKVPYMVACITEAMRVYPPLPSTLPRITPEGAPTPISGYHIPAGTVVGVSQLAAYWDQSNFHAALEYHPERWLPDVYNDPKSPFHSDSRDVLQPFSVGPRNCIGRNLAYAETRSILARLLYNFDFELCPESKDWMNQKIVFWWDKKSMWCRVKPRAVI